MTGILGLHNIVDRPVAIDGKVEIRPIGNLALSYDHRLLDGREAVSSSCASSSASSSPSGWLLESEPTGGTAAAHQRGRARARTLHWHHRPHRRGAACYCASMRTLALSSLLLGLARTVAAADPCPRAMPASSRRNTPATPASAAIRR
ncbi:MAG: 2-oxo acid dehydrogenase subunit E2 [Nannocystaceae bacterium]